MAHAVAVERAVRGEGRGQGAHQVGEGAFVGNLVCFLEHFG